MYFDRRKLMSNKNKTIFKLFDIKILKLLKTTVL